MKTVRQNLLDLKKTVLAATERAMFNAADDIESTGRDVTRRWHHKIDFTDRIARPQQRIEVTIKPKGKRENLAIWGYVEFGTKAHKIPKVVVPGKMLTFRTGYSAFTAPVARYNVGHGRAFGFWRSKKQVNHPGTKPRKFLITFTKKLNPALNIRINREIQKAIG